jgi:S1-C subfamily serine protease
MRATILTILLASFHVACSAQIYECVLANGNKRFTNIKKEAEEMGNCKLLTIEPLHPRSPSTKIRPPTARSDRAVEIVPRPHSDLEPLVWNATPPTFISIDSNATARPDTLYAELSISVYELTSREKAKSRYVSYGSAVAVTPRYALTNCHIVEGSANILALVEKGGRRIRAKLVGATPALDQCVVESISGDLVPVRGVRSFDSLREGERVYAIGNPRGLSQTISDGLISGKRVAKGTRLVQTTAPISSGSSGGGLFDAAGNLIGITTATMVGSQNLNLAIPAEDFWRKTK